MIKSSKTRQIVITFGIPVALLATLIILLNSPFFHRNRTLNLALTIDLLITVPLVYFLLIRKSKIPKTTVVPVMVIGLVIGTFLLPKEDQIFLDFFKSWILPIIEIGIFFYIVLKLKKTISHYKSLKSHSSDFPETLRAACKDLVPEKLIVPFTTELAVIYYGFIHWKPVLLSDNQFSYHKKSTTSSLAGAFILLILIESIWLHFVLQNWNVTLAWILTFFSVYSMIQIFGFVKSTIKRPIVLRESHLHAHYGVISETTIPISEIEAVETSTTYNKDDDSLKLLSPIGGMEGVTVVIHLKSSQVLSGLYGSKKTYSKLGMFIDEPSKFKEAIDDKLALLNQE